ncbi:MAG: hypothetical protein HQK51_15795 [Oligoflexia bacterium]|nr:hypothetical protein [Oligoflexia bacterium]
MGAKKNCWEKKQCERQPGGKKVNELGVCPAATCSKANGIHGGVNGGRSCWAITGTYCGGKVQGSFAAKLGNCLNCEFYKEVQKEESKLESAVDILSKIK